MESMPYCWGTTVGLCQRKTKKHARKGNKMEKEGKKQKNKMEKEGIIPPV